MATIAFLGLGNMGLGMAARLLEAGHDLRLYNRTASRAEGLVQRGAHRFDTPKEAAQGADAVISMVADDVASQALWLGSEGILAAAPAHDSVAIECSTLSHGWVMQLAAHCTARGLRYIDAPVTGLPDHAAAGTLTLLVGASDTDLGHPKADGDGGDGDEQAHARQKLALGILGAFSKRLLRFGPVGAGTAYKLIINLMGAVQIASAAEGMALAERAGLDLATVADALATSQAASPQVVRNTRRIVAADHDRNIVFTSALRLKDVEYALRFAREIGIGSPFGALAGKLYRQLCDMGYAQVNESQIIDASRAQPATH